MERVVILGVGRMPLCKFCRTVWPLSTLGLGVPELFWPMGAGGGDLVAACPHGDRDEAVLVGV